MTRRFFTRASDNPFNADPRAVCDRCGMVYDHSALKPQLRQGPGSMKPSLLLVCSACRDYPMPWMRTFFLPQDPPLLSFPSPENYAIDENPIVASINQNTAGSNLSLILGAVTPNQRTFTVSFWLKSAENTLSPDIFSTSVIPSDTFFRVKRESDTGFDIRNYNSGFSDQSLINDSATGLAGFVDLNVWTHIIFAIDTTQPDIVDRAKIYKNGIQHPTHVFKNLAQNTLFSNFMVGGSTLLFPSASNLVRLNGRLAFLQVLDGVQARAIDLGSQIAGVWKHKPYGGDFGNTGFYFSGDNGFQTKQGVGNAYTFTNSGVVLDYTDIPPYTSI